MEKRMTIYGIIKGLALMALALAAIFMIFCEGDDASLTGHMLVKAGGFGLAWLLIRLTTCSKS